VREEVLDAARALDVVQAGLGLGGGCGVSHGRGSAQRARAHLEDLAVLGSADENHGLVVGAGRFRRPRRTSVACGALLGAVVCRAEA
jgi:hypothetical protein